MIPVGALVVLFRIGSYDRIARICFVRTVNVFGTSHRHTVVITGAALCAHDVIILAAFRQMRSFDTSTVGAAAPEAFRHSNDFFRFRIILDNADRAWFFVLGSRLPLQCYNVFLSIIIMKHGCVEAGGVQVNRLAPRTFWIFCGDDVIIYIEVSCIHGIHDAVHHIEEILRLTVGQARSPDSFCTRQFFQVRIVCVLQGVGIQFPVFHIFRMVDRDTWEPFERRNSEIKVVPFPADTRICVKAGKNRVLNHGKCLLFF